MTANSKSSTLSTRILLLTALDGKIVGTKRPDIEVLVLLTSPHLCDQQVRQYSILSVAFSYPPHDLYCSVTASRVNSCDTLVAASRVTVDKVLTVDQVEWIHIK